MGHAAAAVQVSGVVGSASTHLTDLTNLWHNSCDKESVSSQHCTLISQVVMNFYVSIHSTQTKGVHTPFSRDRLLTESEACPLTRKTGKNVPTPG